MATENFHERNKDLGFEKLSHQRMFSEHFARIPAYVACFFADLHVSASAQQWPANVIQGFYCDDPKAGKVWTERGTQGITQSLSTLREVISDLRDQFKQGGTTVSAMSKILLDIAYIIKVTEKSKILLKELHATATARFSQLVTGDNFIRLVRENSNEGLSSSLQAYESATGCDIELLHDALSNLTLYGAKYVQIVNTLWQSNIKLANRYYNNEEIYSAAVESLGESSRRYDPRLSDFATFAHQWMRKAVADFATFLNCQVVIPTAVYKQRAGRFAVQVSLDSHANFDVSTHALNTHPHDSIGIQLEGQFLTNTDQIESRIDYLKIQRKLAREAPNEQQRRLILDVLRGATIEEISINHQLPTRQAQTVRSEIARFIQISATR